MVTTRAGGQTQSLTQRHLNSHANGQANGHSNGYANGHANGSSEPGKLKDEGRVAVQKKALAYDPCPRSTSYEFLGPPGALAISTLVPFFSYFFDIGCNAKGCPPLPAGQFFANGFRHALTLEFWLNLWDGPGAAIYFAWYAWTVVCWAVLPGRWMQGSVMRNGERLSYKINAFSTMNVTLLATAVLYYLKGSGPFIYTFDHWTGLLSASLLMSITQACYCYGMSFVPGTMLAVGGNTGNVLYDWFIGRTLNPRIGIFDIKTFNELRPGLILWLLLDICTVAKQFNSIGRVTDSLWLVLVFQSIYVVDAMWNEAGIFTQMDITTDGFGFMLAVGDLTWLPFTYGLQARYLAQHPKDLGLMGTIGVVAANAVGYYIFRVANAEKNDFRNGHNPKNLKSMKTERGTELLISGWWSLSRHPNYLGDWIMSVAWCLPTGFSTPVTYFYCIYFAILLVHRQRRDDEACQKKYGKDWEKYCKLVPSRIIPGVY